MPDSTYEKLKQAAAKAVSALKKEDQPKRSKEPEVAQFRGSREARNEGRDEGDWGRLQPGFTEARPGPAPPNEWDGWPKTDAVNHGSPYNKTSMSVGQPGELRHMPEPRPLTPEEAKRLLEAMERSLKATSGDTPADFKADSVEPTKPIQRGFGSYDGNWELPGYRDITDKTNPAAEDAGKIVSAGLAGTPKSRGEALHTALEKVRGMQPSVNKAARSAWGIPMYGKLLEKMGETKPEEPAYVPSAQEQQQADMKAQIDAIQYANEQARIEELRKKLLSGN